MDLSKPQKFDICRGQRCSCSSSWGHGKILSKRPIPERILQYLTRWAGTALPNTSLGQTGVTNAASSQIKNSRPTACSLPGSKKR